ncbi:LemA family protein [bacterium]|nr:LemA family protein [bacterium]
MKTTSRGVASTWVIIGVLTVIVLMVGGKYNGLVRSNEGVTAQWAQVGTQYQRRVDLIPNLVESVKGVMKQEQTVFGALAQARANYAGARSTDEKAAAAGQVESAFGRLLAVMENYPQLKSAENVQSLMAEIAGTENRVSVERMRYNEIVRDFNVSVKTFPGSLLASWFGFAPRTMFEAEVGADKAPKVQF